jgi:hypothetical protein
MSEVWIPRSDVHLDLIEDRCEILRTGASNRWLHFFCRRRFDVSSQAITGIAALLRRALTPGACHDDQ